MGENKCNKKKRIICLIVLDILFAFSIVFLFSYIKNIDTDSLYTVVEENNGHTTITISLYLNKVYFYLYSLIFLAINLIILTIILVVVYIKNKKLKLRYGITATILSNTIMTLLLFPTMILFALIFNIFIIIVFLLKYLYERKLNRKNSILEKDDMKNKNNGGGDVCTGFAV